MEQGILTKEEGNKIIAIFMGLAFHESTAEWTYEHPEDGTAVIWSDDNPPYDTSWDWLMPVVEKIEQLGFGFTVDPFGIEIIDYTTGKEEVRVRYINDDNYPKIEQYYASVTEFITWYNNQTKQP
jgi:hypothetical protein